LRSAPESLLNRNLEINPFEYNSDAEDSEDDDVDANPGYVPDVNSAYIANINQTPPQGIIGYID